MGSRSSILRDRALLGKHRYVVVGERDFFHKRRNLSPYT
ncbi:hypothetical protein CCACVL1_02497 [Corchorus capsularis]|uniref:Uncharacterized protein n=1 Tax=Corchorus capsularis TaxID=210143 RepID=A0A1R3K815_COCAP|nr:hypothetical protein CCACVL1_02497 [Corchorus capsularis]